MQLGLIGLGTMGANLARNAARNGATVAVYNRTKEKLDAFIEEHGKEGVFVACKTYAELAKALKPPRPILLMVKAGEAVDQVLKELLPHLQKGDIVIDAGNSHYRDTEKREAQLLEKGIHLIGLGVSGGEEGALKGPSMMPGGSKEAYAVLEPLLKKMAADDGSTLLPSRLGRAETGTTGGAKGKCVTYLGKGGVGHFVKMVHNGIEYGIMQLLAEAYHLLKVEGNMTNADIAQAFETWNGGYLHSFLVEIAAKVMREKDPDTKKDLIDVIKDAAGQKGTGKWTTDAAMHYGVAVPTITAAVDARIVSGGRDFRMQMSKHANLTKDTSVSYDKKVLIEMVRAALELSVLNTYAQGFQLLFVPSAEEKWSLNVSEVARIWRGGCIIRSDVLSIFQESFKGDEKASKEIRDRFSDERQLQWRRVVALGALHAIPLPALAASLTYFDAYRTAWLPQNLTQAQRDYFGAHTYERLDKPGSFHTKWQ
ncbi:NADP-dependent phosphogluconate dehydrogenase [Candidatus Peregrinibacteria bacterium]|nr:NADP-dependent phosphogluconate dehydrogenase [Candidatus Peregrinibacteria bacterium]